MASSDYGMTESGELRAVMADFTFNLPDGSSKSTSLTEDEVRSLVGADREYQIHWWVHGAELKLAIDPIAFADANGIYSSACGVHVTERGMARFEISYNP